MLRLRFDSLKRSGDRAAGIIDDLNWTGRPFFELAALPNVAPRGTTLYVAGWIHGAKPALDPPEIFITVDGAFAAAAQGGFARPDVAKVRGPAALSSGFRALVPTAGLEEGWHTVAAAQLVDAETYRIGPERPIQIARNALRAPIVTPAGGQVYVVVDRLLDGPDAPPDADGIPVFGPDATIRVMGWAADLDRAQPCAAVYALVDGVHTYRGRYGIARPDVGEEVACAQLALSGFEVRVDAGTLPPGAHTLSVIALSADGETRSAAAPELPFSIRPE